MVTSKNLGYLGSWIGSYFLKQKYIEAKSIYWYLAHSNTIVIGVIRHLLSPTMIHVDVSYSPKCKEFFFFVRFRI